MYGNLVPVSDVVNMLQMYNNLNKHLAKYASPSVEYEYRLPDGTKAFAKREELFDAAIEKLCNELLHKAAGKIDGA